MWSLALSCSWRISLRISLNGSPRLRDSKMRKRKIYMNYLIRKLMSLGSRMINLSYLLKIRLKTIKMSRNLRVTRYCTHRVLACYSHPMILSSCWGIMIWNSKILRAKSVHINWLYLKYKKYMMERIPMIWPLREDKIFRNWKKNISESSLWRDTWVKKLKNKRKD